MKYKKKKSDFFLQNRGTPYKQQNIVSAIPGFHRLSCNIYPASKYGQLYWHIYFTVF